MKAKLYFTLAALFLAVGCSNPEKTIAECQANLRKIAEAKEQVALEKAGPLGNPLPAGWVPPESEILLLTKMKSLTCSGGGKYAVNAHDVKPACSIAAHNAP